MEFLTRSWRQIGTQLNEMSANARWLIIVLIVCGVLAVLLSLTIFGSPDYVTITGFAGDRQADVVGQLTAAGIKVKSSEGQLHVPPDRHADALAVLAYRDLIAPDASAAFDELIKNSTVWESNEKFRQKFRIAKMKMLGQVISKMKDVRSTDVVFEVPQRQGFGANFLRPSASVSVMMEGRAKVSRRLGESIAGLVSSAVAGMTPQDVVIIDANHGTQLTVKDEGDFGAAEHLLGIRQREQYIRQKVAGMLHYIKGVIVAVNVQVEPISSRIVKGTTYEASELLRSTETIVKESVQTTSGGESGARPNTGLNIASTSSGGNSEVEEIERADYGNKPIVEQKEEKWLGQSIKKINVTVSVPRSHLVKVFMRRGGEPTAEDKEAGDTVELEDVFIQEQLGLIQQSVTPQIETQDNPGVLSVAMYDDGPMHAAAMMPTATGISVLLKPDWMRPVGLTLLVLTTLAMMFTMVRKATQQQQLPAAEELAGLPPTLPIDDELFGEADDSELSMDGVEIAEKDIRSRKIADQISKLVKDNPEEAVDLMNKWLQPED